MVLVDLLSEGFGTVTALGDAGEIGQEAAQAAGALEAPGVDVQDTGAPEGLKVPGLAQVSSLAADAGAEAVRTACGFKR